ncbi:hypothetical protein VOLCADRAFT_89129 [Volvox carteri f. nagariensis]|uniref:Uncharacterized protein n=1 Tax=Volvox carteri f. nagariensis TaxID=3068 RepID=D8TQV6_VOLCA|nr:uncharacterized protein VOLCADRAFT_89129 [Volvox carteri f. nagariensis]EFJ50098.1 hypothetical protein VOLCADRAFT_89129 [Volvox carteri f. nagariensis]|eukprot:XP_002948718.1 hypothetical protein VOLCADRAFT_89129 [Volvox carteri f. nagariensis]
MINITMSLTSSQQQLSEAFRSKDGKLPEIFRILAETKAAPDTAETWITAAKIALSKDEPEHCKGILEAFRESNHDNLAATLLLSKACQRLGSEDALDESVVLARKAVSIASGAEDVLRASVQLAMSLGNRARLRTRQQVERQQDRDEAIRVLSSLEALSSASREAGSSNPPPAAVSSSSSSSADVVQGLYTIALLQAEHGGSQLRAAKDSAVTAWQAAQTAGESQLTSLSLVLLSNILSAGWPGAQGGACMPGPATPSSPSSPPLGATQPPFWSDVLVWRLRSRLLAALEDTGPSLAALVTAKKLLAGWLERGALPAGVTKATAEEELAKVWGELAVAMAHAGGGQEAAEALASIDQALALRPWAADTRHSLGAVHEALGQYDEAAAAYDDALALDPTHAPTLLRKGALHVRNGSRPDLAAARDLLAEALRYDPRNAAGWHELGRVAAALEHRAQAEEHMLIAVRLASEAPAMQFSELPMGPPTSSG